MMNVKLQILSACIISVLTVIPISGWAQVQDDSLDIIPPPVGDNKSLQYSDYHRISDKKIQIKVLKDKSKELTNEIADIQPLPGLESSETRIKKLESLEHELNVIINHKIPSNEALLEAWIADYKATYMAEGSYAIPARYKNRGFSIRADYVYFENEVPGTGTSALLVPPNMTERFLLGGDWDVSGDGVEIGINYNTGKALPEGIDKNRKSSDVGFNFNWRKLNGDDTRSAQYDPGVDKVAFIYQTKFNISPGHYSTGVLMGENSMTSTATMEYDETTFNAGFGWLCGDDLFSNAGWIFNPFANIGYRDIETNTKSRDYLTDFPNDFHAEAESRLDTSSLTGNIGANFIYPASNNLSLNFKSSIGIAYSDANLDTSQQVRAGGTPDVNIQLTDDKTWWSPEFSIGIGGDYNFTDKFSVTAGLRYEYRDTAGVNKPETGDAVLAGESTSIDSEGTNNSSAYLGARIKF